MKRRTVVLLAAIVIALGAATIAFENSAWIIRKILGVPTVAEIMKLPPMSDSERQQIAERGLKEKSDKLSNDQLSSPQRRALLRGRASDYETLHQLENALADLTEALRLDPSNADLFLARGNFYYRQKMMVEAFADYEAGAKLDPNNSAFPYIAANFHTEKSEWDAAIADYTKAIALEDGIAIYYMFRGDALLELNRIEPAISDFTRAIDLQRGLLPRDLQRAHMERGRALGKLNKFDLAILDFNSLLDIDATGAYAGHAYGLRGFSYENIGDKARALADYKKALELLPTETWIIDRVKKLELNT